MTTKLGNALREKYGDPRKVLAFLGLDEGLIDAHSQERTMKTPTKFANLALQMVSLGVKPLLAKDAKIDLLPIFKDMTAKTFDKKKVRMAMDSALKGKLAKDSETHMGHVAQMLDHIESMTSPEVLDESVSEPQHKAMEAAAHGESDLDIPEKVGKEFAEKDKAAKDKNSPDAGGSEEGLRAALKEKGMADDDINGVCDLMFKKTVNTDESPEDKEKREKEAADKKAADEKAEEETTAEKEKAMKAEMSKDMVTKPAMDAAIKAAVDLTAKTVKDEVRATERAIRQATQDVLPYVGVLSPSLAFDTAADVYSAALKMRNVDVTDVHPSAFPTLLKMLPKTGEKSIERETPLAMDAAASKELTEMFPGIDRIGAA